MENVAPEQFAPVLNQNINCTVEDNPDSDSHELQDHLDPDIESANEISPFNIKYGLENGIAPSNRITR